MWKLAIPVLALLTPCNVVIMIMQYNTLSMIYIYILSVSCDPLYYNLVQLLFHNQSNCGELCMSFNPFLLFAT